MDIYLFKKHLLWWTFVYSKSTYCDGHLSIQTALNVIYICLFKECLLDGHLSIQRALTVMDICPFKERLPRWTFVYSKSAYCDGHLSIHRALTVMDICLFKERLLWWTFVYSKSAYCDGHLSIQRALTVISKISLLRQLATYVPTHIQKVYYQGYILPYIDYGSVTWGSASATNTERISKLQKRAARIILLADYDTPSVSWDGCQFRTDLNIIRLSWHTEQ